MTVILVVVFVVSGGIAMIYLARYARRKHEQLRRAGIRKFDAARIVHARTPGEWFKLQFFGPQPKLFEAAGPFLAVGVIVFVTIVLVGILGVIIVRAWQ
jgi:hypothetical protein